jgi:hypothetical protein
LEITLLDKMNPEMNLRKRPGEHEHHRRRKTRYRQL